VSFAATANETVPFPLPLAPLVTVIQLAFDAAVHPHPAPAVIATESLPPAAAALLDVFDSVNVHDGVLLVFGRIVESFAIKPGRVVEYVSGLSTI
jgi:hypothetical protein